MQKLCSPQAAKGRASSASVAPAESPQEAAARKRKLATVGEDVGSAAWTAKEAEYRAWADDLELDEDKRRAVVHFDAGLNLNIDGEAGTGKSFLFRYLVGRARYVRKSVAIVTGTTGCSAQLVGGVTINAASSMSDFSKSLKFYLDRLDSVALASTRAMLCEAAYLFIDEISMMHPVSFWKLGEMFKHVRGNKRPFGGIQVVVAGDMAQLPPVHRGAPRNYRAAVGDGYLEYVFETDTWRDLAFENVRLTRVYRQSDEAMLGALADIRNGTVTRRVENFMAACSNTVFPDDGLSPTVLFAKKAPAEQCNNEHLDRLRAPRITYTATVNVNIDPKYRSHADVKERFQRYANDLDTGARVPRVLNLKMGAQVLLVKNIEIDGQRYNNGMKGIIVGFGEDPAILALRTPAEGDAGEPAASKPTTVDASGAPMPKRARTQHPATPKYPMVAMENGDTITVLPQSWEISEEGIGSAVRTHVPLILGYAQSMHSMQGAQVSRVEVRMQDIFAPGQAYIALSRATTPEGLRVRGYEARYIFAHPKVKEYFRLGLSWHHYLDVRTCRHLSPDPLGDRQERLILETRFKAQESINSQTNFTWKNDNALPAKTQALIDHTRAIIARDDPGADGTTAGRGRGRGRGAFRGRGRGAFRGRGLNGGTFGGNLHARTW
jgi:ATP-dependent DNA helicase PIF1